MKVETAITLVLLVAAPINLLAEETKGDKAEEERQLITTNSTETVQEPGSALFRISGIGMFAASGLDVATTEWGLQQPGIYEGNPVVGNRGARVAFHVVAPAAVWWTTEKLHKSGHGKLALALRIGLMVAYSYAAIHNTRMVHGR